MRVAVHNTTGHLVFFAGAAISWLSRVQKTVALSSTEAEYMSLSDISRQLSWIHSLMSSVAAVITKNEPRAILNQENLIQI
jgi:hypothetical protein